VLVDPERVLDRATYDAPLLLAEGIDDVLVGGVPVLAGGELTGATPGRGIRRSPARMAHTAP
jgi:N-acyl-D-amino-acid deacylase